MTMTPPFPLPDQLDAPIRYLFTDVDDTLTWEGRLPSQTFIALERLQQSGISVIPVTGACAGWCDCIVRTWPVAAVIGENGAFWMQRDTRGHIVQSYRQPASERSSNRTRLQLLQQELTQAHDFARVTADQPYRETDIAFDIGQQFQISPQQQQALLELLLDAGVQARISSIHINAWLGEYDKASTARAWLKQEMEQQGKEIEDQAVAFIGDSGNDATMFEQFSTTVGVANIERFLDSLPRPPRFITQAQGGFGFVEFAERLLKQA